MSKELLTLVYRTLVVSQTKYTELWCRIYCKVEFISAQSSGNDKLFCCFTIYNSTLINEETCYLINYTYRFKKYIRKKFISSTPTFKRNVHLLLR